VFGISITRGGDMKFFNLDLHCSVIEDVKYFFNRLGHQVDSQLLSNHAWVHGRVRQDTAVITGDNWRELSPEMCDRFYETYRHAFDDYDGFIVCFVPSLTALFKRFGKPIITVFCIRYEAPFTARPELWKWLNDEVFLDGISRGHVIPVASCRFDQVYCRRHLGLEIPYIPSVAAYYDAPYWSRRPDWLLWSRVPVPFRSPWISDAGRHLMHPYTWHDLSAFRGCIHIPYSVYSMKLCEQYWAGQPLVFPSLRFLMELYKEHGPFRVVEETTWEQVEKLPPLPITDAPNNYVDYEVVERWLRLADYYDSSRMPHVHFFGSFNELPTLLHDLDVKVTSIQMRAHNRWLHDHALAGWRQILSGLK
jgi:hypothetical protein